ncbi:FAD/NAD(P)-binding domain-containing protein [Violaceomyces palustris]|uniref:FAD/NAD(P)-binding domain-containing protein n=1 Tax=Violaceomyces palustris TaxID=1673888 RepID=A0ACD0NWR6_9BASI|nr:FAD/NAD(P)-binding domain-containing protein [Violaceomyces palustris]
MNWLEEIGVHQYLVQERLRPVEAMKVWDGLSGATIDFDAAQLMGLGSGSSDPSAQISCMVEISNLQQAMLRFLEDNRPANVEIRDQTKVERIVPGFDTLLGTCSPGTAERDPWPVLELSSPTSVHDRTPIRARLLVGADGPNSPVRKYANIDNYGWSYGRKGLVATMRCAGFEDGEPPVPKTAWQRFLPSGTIAFLPLSDKSGSLVWALPPDLADSLITMNRQHAAASRGESADPLAQLVSAAFRLPWSAIEDLLEQIRAQTLVPLREGDVADWSWVSEEILRHTYGQSLPESLSGEVPPRVAKIDAKTVASFPLQLKHADAYIGSSLNNTVLRPSGILANGLAMLGIAPEGAGQGGGRSRTALVGDAAHSIHPLAGQGLNLGIADVRSLIQTLGKALQVGADIGSYNALMPYPRDRYLKNQIMLSAVDHLHWLYSSPVPWSHGTKGREVTIQQEGLLRSLMQEGLARGTLWARSTGLEVVNEIGSLKSIMMKHAGSSAAVRGSGRPASWAYTNPDRASSVASSSSSGRDLDSATNGTPSVDSLTPAQRKALTEMLRVDHSGEVAANTIYQAQADVFGALGNVKMRDMMREMWSTEKKHLDVMEKLLKQHNVRPSALLPVWSLAGRVLGGVTALMGARSAMACTEAVESVIGEHYDDQLAHLSTIVEPTGTSTSTSTSIGVRSVTELDGKWEEQGDRVDHPSLPLLSSIIEEFRDDELEHLDTAVENESQQAPAHALLSAVIAAGCKGAIWMAAKV